MLKILLVGEGGQGVQSIAEIITKALSRIGQKVSYIPSFGVEQRGGASLAYVSADDKPIKYPRFSEANIVLIMCNRAIEVAEKFLTSESAFIFDGSNIADDRPKPLHGKFKSYLNIPARKIALEKFSLSTTNILMLGALIHYIPELDPDTILKVMDEKFKNNYEKKPELQDLNIRAFQAGIDFAKNPVENSFSGTLEKREEKFSEDDKKSWKNNPELCKGCGLCIVRCPVQALQFCDKLNFLGTQTPEVDIKKCIGCELCQLTCPDGAIEVKVKE